MVSWVRTGDKCLAARVRDGIMERWLRVGSYDKPSSVW